MTPTNTDWILVRGGTAEAVTKAVLAHADLTDAEVPTAHRGSVFAFAPGRFAVRFDPPLPPYTFTNLVGWLDDPRMCVGSELAAGWLTSPGTGKRYHLVPRRAGAGGDTLMGVDENGDPVAVYLPDGGLREATFEHPSRELLAEAEPVVPFAELQPVATFETTADSDRGFGNPDFVEG